MVLVSVCTTQEVNHVYILFSITQITANASASLDEHFCDQEGYQMISALIHLFLLIVVYLAVVDRFLIVFEWKVAWKRSLRILPVDPSLVFVH
jgi:hypothetical protein